MATTECTVFPTVEVFKGFAINGEGGSGAWAVLLKSSGVWVASFAIEDNVDLLQLQCVAEEALAESLGFAHPIAGQGVPWHTLAQQLAAHALAASIESRHNENMEETSV